MSRRRPLAPGLNLRGYRLVSQLGVGGDGEVWLARGSRGEEVALKARPRPSRAEASILFREFEHLRTLRIPSVVRVLDAGMDQGYVFFTMDVAHGQTLDLYVGATGSLRERVLRTARVGAGVADALAAIHRLGLAHNDIKPANVLVDEHGRVTLLDFGTARFGPAATAPELRGTVAYMAPEQRAGHPHDRRVDLYALGVTLYEALSGIPARHFGPTQPRPSLMRLGPEVGPRLDWVLRATLSLDPAERPSAEEVQGELAVLADEAGSSREAPWPEPAHYVGDLPPLLDGRAVLIGAPGTGRRRTLQEARRRWFRKGYRSIAGRCRPDQPFAALRQLLSELLGDPAVPITQALSAEELQVLHALAPELPVPASAPDPWPPDPFATAAALSGVLARHAPIAVVLWELDEADIGSLAVLAALLPQLDPAVRVWATARRPVLSLPPLHPPAWGREREQAVLTDLLGEAPKRQPGRPATTPLLSCARGWRHLAHRRALRGPPEHLPDALADLTVLPRPLPQEVARALVDDAGDTTISALLEAGHLTWAALGSAGGSGPAIGEEDPNTERTAPFLPSHLDFSDPTTERLAAAAVRDPRAAHLRAAEAWRRCPPSAERLQEIARHLVCAGQPSTESLDAVILLEAQRGAASEVDRWLRLRDLHCGVDDHFHVSYARLYSALELRPQRVRLADLRALAAAAVTPVERGLAAYLRLIHEARRGDAERAVALGRRWVKALQLEQPAIAAQMLREVGLAHLGRNDLDDAIASCERALRLARKAASRPVGATPEITAALLRSSGGQADRLPLTPAEIGSGTTLSAALLYSGRTAEAVDLCHELADRCRRAGQFRGEGALRANAAIGLFQMGRRTAAAEACSAARAVQGRHHDPIILAHVASLEARLAVERGEPRAARRRIDEALTAGRSASHRRVQAEAWCMVMESATHTLDLAEAQRALTAYGVDGVTTPRDPWPAVLARWRWLVGDLPGALQAVEETREGHGGLCVQAERARLLLVARCYEDAGRVALAVQDQAEATQAEELALFAQLVSLAARGAPDELFLPALRRTERSRWVHLYLGGAHLDAIRRQLRGENVRPVVRRLHRRASELGHRLYSALSRVEAW